MARETTFAPVRGLSDDTLSRLHDAVKGAVILPDDADYDTARAIFYGGFDARPGVIVRPVDAADVAAIVSIARDTGTELAIRSGGHSMAGHGASHGGIVLDLSAMKALDIDVEGRTLWAETGLTAGEVTAAASEHGLVVGFGDTGSVGIGGITLGGGVGFLVRKYGLTIDDLLAAEVVTADGQIRYVDATAHPDLFWAIRGGGGNFGVATRFKFRLHEFGQIYGGTLVLPASADLVRAFVAEAEAAPEELSIIANVMVAPPMPFFPPEAHGKLIIFALMVYAGDAEAGEQAVAPFRALATPVSDMLRPMHYHEMYPPEEGGYHPQSVGRNLFVDSIDQTATERMIEALQQSTAMMSVVQLRVLGGAMARVPADATAFGHRAERLMLNVAAIYQNPDEAAIHEAWVNQLAAALQSGQGRAYVNFIGSEGAERVRDAYPAATWERLRQIKARYDPTNLFRLNQNIPPAVEAVG